MRTKSLAFFFHQIWTSLDAWTWFLEKQAGFAISAKSMHFTSGAYLSKRESYLPPTNDKNDPSSYPVPSSDFTVVIYYLCVFLILGIYIYRLPQKYYIKRTYVDSVRHLDSTVKLYINIQTLGRIKYFLLLVFEFFFKRNLSSVHYIIQIIVQYGISCGPLYIC